MGLPSVGHEAGPCDEGRPRRGEKNHQVRDSAGRPNRFIGTSRSMRCSTPARSRCRFSSHEPPGNRMWPGATTLTRTLRGASRRDQSLPVAIRAAFAAAYGTGAPIDSTPAMTPRTRVRRPSPSPAARLAQGGRPCTGSGRASVPIRRLRRPSHGAAAVAGIRNDDVERPHRSTHACTHASQTRGSARSPACACTRSAPAPDASASRAASRCAASRPVRSTRAPSATNASAIARPMPRLEPPTSAT